MEQMGCTILFHIFGHIGYCKGKKIKRWGWGKITLYIFNYNYDYLIDFT